MTGSATLADTHGWVDASRGSKTYRYPGSPPFRDVAVDRQLFKGRDEESRTVLHSILSSDLFLLYAVSGMGKSSLLNAGVMQELRQRGYWPVSVRLNDPSVPPAVAIEQQIIGAAEVDDQIEIVRTPGIDIDAVHAPSLWDVLGSIEVWRGSGLEHLVIVLDQFEELFTLDWDDALRTRFISEFGEVVRRSRADDVHRDGENEAFDLPPPDVKFVLVVREDALGELEALATDVPQVMQHRFRLGPLDPDQALAAIREPALVDDDHLETQQFAYTEDAAQEILSFLQQAERSSTATISEAHRSQLSVDPSQLQIICQYIERRVLPTKNAPTEGERIEIDSSDLGGVDGLRSILGDFYRRTVASFPESDHRRIRELCERGLISPSERRLSLESGAISDAFDVPLDVLDSLVDHRLLRAEPRVGSVYYELAHDTLVHPILVDREERQRERSRRRRRRAKVVGSTIAAIVGVGAFIATAPALDGDRAGSPTNLVPSTQVPVSTLPPAVVLGFERPEVGMIDTAGSISEFVVAARSEPIQIVVEPGPSLDVAVSVTSASGARRTQDQLGRGERETIVVPSGADAGDVLVAVTSNDESTGDFTISSGGVDVIALTASQPQRGAIAEPGANMVFAIDASTTVALDVQSRNTPLTDSRGGRNKGLDVEVQVIDQSGRGRTVDAAGPGERESTTIDGAIGQTLVVVRGYQTSIGDFDITMRDVDRSVLERDEPRTDQSVVSGQPVEYAIQVSTEGLAAIVTPIGSFDPVLEVIGPDGLLLTIDTAGGGEIEVVNLSERGQHVLRVNSLAGPDGTARPDGRFDITAIATIPLGAERAEVAPTTPAAFVIESETNRTFVLTATPDGPDDQLAVRALGPSGYPVGSGTSATSGGTATVVFDSDAEQAVFGRDLASTAPQLVLVTSASATGATVELASLQVVRLSDEPVSVDLPAAFEVQVANDDVLILTAEPKPSVGALTVEIDSAFGYTSRRSSATGDPVVVVLSASGGFDGTQRAVVFASDGGGEITAALTKPEPVRLEVDALPRELATPAVFDVDVDVGGIFVLTAEPGGPDELVTLQVSDSVGYIMTDRRSPDVGDPAVIVIGGDDVGRHRVVATSSNPQGTISAGLSLREPVPLEVGAVPLTVLTERLMFPQTAPAPAVFDFDVPGGQVAVASVQGGATTVLDVQIRNVAGGFTRASSSPSPGVPVLTLLDQRDGFGGEYRMIVGSNATDDTISTTIDAVTVQSIVAGQSLDFVSAPAVFDVVIDGDETLTLLAETDASNSLLTAQVFDISGFPLDQRVYQPLPSQNELPEDVIALFSPEVRELFAEGLPPTVDEAVAQLVDAGLLNEVISVLDENDIAAEAFLGGADPSTTSAQVTMEVSGSDFGAGRYRVVVNSVDRTTGLRVQLLSE